MANRRVTIWKYVKVGENWRYCKPVIASNNAIKPNWVLVNGKPEKHKEGNYYVHSLQGNKQIWKKAGPHVADAHKWFDYEQATCPLEPKAFRSGAIPEPRCCSPGPCGAIWKSTN